MNRQKRTRFSNLLEGTVGRQHGGRINIEAEKFIHAVFKKVKSGIIDAQKK